MLSTYKYAESIQMMQLTCFCYLELDLVADKAILDVHVPRCMLFPNKNILYEYWQSHSNTLRPGQNGRHFAEHIFKYICLNWHCCIIIQIWLSFLSKVQLMISQHWLSINYLIINDGPFHRRIYTSPWLVLFTVSNLPSGLMCLTVRVLSIGMGSSHTQLTWHTELTTWNIRSSEIWIQTEVSHQHIITVTSRGRHFVSNHL